MDMPSPTGVRDFDSGQSPGAIDGMKFNLGETEIFVKIEFKGEGDLLGPGILTACAQASIAESHSLTPYSRLGSSTILQKALAHFKEENGLDL
jgi:hypothetical protein